MAEDMIERAAKALAREIGEPIVSHATIRKDWSSMTDMEHRALRFGARDALLAALDPEDASMLERIAKRIFLSRYKDSTHEVQAFQWSTRREAFLDDALAAVNALKSIAQGVTP